MATNAKPENQTPWYLRIKTLLITAGGLAAALVSVITLLNLLSNPDENDEARITLVEVVKPMMLLDFQTDRLGGELSLESASGGIGRGSDTVALVSGHDVVAPFPSRGPQPANTADPVAPSSETTPEPTDTPATTDTPSDTPTPTDTPSDTPTPTDTPSDTPTPTAEPENREAAVMAIVNDPLWDDLGARPGDVGFLGDIGDTGDPEDANNFHPRPGIGPPGAAGEQGRAAGSDGTGESEAGGAGESEEGGAGESQEGGVDKMPSADDVVTHIVEALAAIEGEGVGMEGRHGYLVGVDMEFAGYVGEEMVLTYSLDPAPGGGAEVPESWAAEKLGYYFTPSTQMDTGFAEVWVPDLIAPGPFVVNAVVSLVSDGVPIARAQSEIIPE